MSDLAHGLKERSLPGETHSFCNCGTVVTLCVSGALSARIEAPRIHRIHPIHPCHSGKRESANRPFAGLLATYEESQAFVEEDLAEDGANDNGDRSQRCNKQRLGKSLHKEKAQR